MLIAQISDTHVTAEGTLAYDRVDTAAHAARCVAHLCQLDPRPDVVLFTGDLVDGGTADEYRYLRDLLAPLSMPVLAVPGNHDDRDHMRAAFEDQHYLPHAGYLQYVVNDHQLRLIGLDTLVPDRPEGYICDERLEWLDARLAEASGRPTVLFMHHPPFATSVSTMDAMGLGNADALAKVVGRHRQVEAVLCGHLHRPVHVRWAGTVASTAPGAAHQVALDLRVDGDLAAVMEPPAVQLHIWRPDAGLVSHISYVGDYGAPHLIARGRRRS